MTPPGEGWVTRDLNFGSGLPGQKWPEFTYEIRAKYFLTFSGGSNFTYEIWAKFFLYFQVAQIYNINLGLKFGPTFL